MPTNIEWALLAGFIWIWFKIDAVHKDLVQLGKMLQQIQESQSNSN